jgi:hypothetical protein
MQLLLETSYELSSSVREDGVGHPMQTYNVLNVQLCISLGLVTCMNKDEVSRLHESINNHLDGIILEGSQRETHDEIHTDVSPLPGRSILRLQQTSMFEMICFDPSTSVTFCNIADSLALHPRPSELHFQVMVHLGAARVNRIFGCVSFIKDLLS